jgi:hypothetical protein
MSSDVTYRRPPTPRQYVVHLEANGLEARFRIVSLLPTNRELLHSWAQGRLSILIRRTNR